METIAVYVMNIIVLCVVAFALISCLHGSPSSTVTVDLPGQGTIQGDYDTTRWSKTLFMSFLGIPFAESPNGNLRFKHAVKRLPWRHVLDATVHGRRCPVITSIKELNETELQRDLEDCLNLCVYSKNLTAKQPVMFYIYGGGFYNGSNIDHPPHYLLEKDIVLVVPNYRVGALGWLSTRSKEMPGNGPISDLFVALQWVQEYIHLFGGDPSQVTIFGQSAGTVMSGALLLSPKTQPQYFHRSIQQSGSIFGSWAINRKPFEQVQRICEKIKCSKGCSNIDEMYECLRNISVPRILEATEQESFAPIIGDFFNILPREPAVLFEEFNRTIPLMTGFTKHDGSFVLASVYDAMHTAVGNLSYITVRQFADTLLSAAKDDTGLTTNLLTRMLFTNSLLYSRDHKKAIPAYFDLTNIVAMKSPVMALASKMFQKSLGNVYLYSFDYEGSNTRFGYEFGNDHYPFEGGVHHSNDNIYLFSTHTLNEADTEMSKKMVELWTSFAIAGEPSLGNNLNILPMSSEVGPFIHINTDVTISNDILQELTVTIDDPYNFKLDRPDVEF